MRFHCILCGKPYPRHLLRCTTLLDSRASLHALAFSATAPSEPAWHRRARHQRSQDRVLLSVASAVGRLRAHHGSSVPSYGTTVSVLGMPKKWKPQSAKSWYGGGQDYRPRDDGSVGRSWSSWRQSSSRYGRSMPHDWSDHWQSLRHQRHHTTRRNYVPCPGFGSLCRGWAWSDAQRPWCRTCGCGILPRKPEPWEEENDDHDYDDEDTADDHDDNDDASMDGVEEHDETIYDWNAEGIAGLTQASRTKAQAKLNDSDQTGDKVDDDATKFGRLQKFLAQLWGKDKARALYNSFKAIEDDADDQTGANDDKKTNRTSRKELTRHLQSLANEKDAIKKSIGRIDAKIAKLDKQLDTAWKQRANFRERVDEVEARYQKTFSTIAALDASPSDDDDDNNDIDADANGYRQEETTGTAECFDMGAEELQEHQTWQQSSGGRRRRTENTTSWTPSHDSRVTTPSTQTKISSSSSSNNSNMLLSGPKFFRPKAKSEATGNKIDLRRPLQGLRVPKGKEARSKALLEEAIRQAQQKIDELEERGNSDDDDEF